MCRELLVLSLLLEISLHVPRDLEHVAHFFTIPNCHSVLLSVSDQQQVPKCSLWCPLTYVQQCHVQPSASIILFLLCSWYKVMLKKSSVCYCLYILFTTCHRFYWRFYSSWFLGKETNITWLCCVRREAVEQNTQQSLTPPNHTKLLPPLLIKLLVVLGASHEWSCSVAV